MHFRIFIIFHIFILVDLIKRGSETAKGGFSNEKAVCEKFNNYLIDKEAQKWLILMNYDLHTINDVKAYVVKSKVKADLTIKIITEHENTVNISLKKMNSCRGFNQIDKRWIRNYKSLWNFDETVELGLKLFTGEEKRDISTRDLRRATLLELPVIYKEAILNWFIENKLLVLADIFKGRDKYSVSWLLVTKYNKFNNTTTWKLVDIQSVLNYYGQGEVIVSPKGSLLIGKTGKITMQRKGGDGGRKTSQMLQFKMNPGDVFDL